jgi:hypothetical protein
MVKKLMLLTAMVLALTPEVLAAEPVPKPKLRPGTGAAEPGISVPVAIPIPVPRPRPAPADGQQQADPPTPPPEARVWSTEEIAEERRACQALLQGLALEFDTLDPIGEPGGCGAPAPVSVSRVAGVTLEPAATLTCDMAAALHGWVSGTLKPAARERLKTEVTAIGTGTSYACRRRNNSSGGKLSEHGRANALDMSGFVFADPDKQVSVSGGKWGEGILAALGVSPGGSFLEAVRKGACQHFTTVLGPGSDPYHGDHFHVDVLRRKNGYRICQ